MAVGVYNVAAALVVLLTTLCRGVPVGLSRPRTQGRAYSHFEHHPQRDQPQMNNALDLPTPTISSNITTERPRKGSQNSAVKFMQQFGYMPKPIAGAAPVFTQEYFREQITKLQRFGDIPQTGELDNATLELMDTPRCGLPDLDPEDIDGNHRRRKRYIVGSEGWNKRNLTYYLANWSGKLLSKENVQKELRRAFDAWSTYSLLRFTEVDETQYHTADIVLFFAEYNHQDGYPFDGPSGILAHAYYPYEFGHYGGDVHFDESEEWTMHPKDQYSGLDFFTVAVHELGHSLGLSHSPVGGSIMFPYYKGYTANFALDHDDVMAMWELYIKRKLDGDDEYVRFQPTATTVSPPTEDDESHQADATDDDDSDSHSSGDENEGKRRTEEDDFYEEDRKRREEVEKKREEERKRKAEEDAERKRWEEEIRKREEEIRRREAEERRKWEEEERQRDEAWKESQGGGNRGNDDNKNDKKTTVTPKEPPPVPDLCDGNFDAVAVIRQELFVFKGQYLWRFSERNQLRQGYPSHIRNMFKSLPSYLQKVDAVYERKATGEIVFFIGKYFYVHNGDRLEEGYPKPITEFGLPEVLTELDSVFFWPRAEKLYFFSRNLYWRYNETAGIMDKNYPRDLSRWNGLPTDIQAAFTYTDGTSYFFKGKEYWRYNNQNIAVDNGYPRDATLDWCGC
ncbi:unnamed protein product [Meganyctiphanes norvegica]|uniref:Peptidase metallopeptidase domain-containing protein n=1 Tax=Meganyctiphanes norvegica TaxID=48144 RepID=A0AAV2R9B5_MEGNR